MLMLLILLEYTAAPADAALLPRNLSEEELRNEQRPAVCARPGASGAQGKVWLFCWPALHIHMLFYLNIKDMYVQSVCLA